MGRSRQDRLDRLIEDVAHGRRELGSIRDEAVREGVRIARRVHRDGAALPDDLTRMRIRARVLAGLDPRPATLRDHAWTALVLLARPAPYIVRAFAVTSVLITAAMSAVVASADTLPEDALYSVKLATERARLALAVAPEDRATVELSIAAHRLREIEVLAERGRTSDVLLASAAYSKHVASAAAELAPVADSQLVDQLEAYFAGQRDRANTLAVALATSVRSAAAAEVLATIASSAVVPAANGVQRVANAAASLAESLVAVAQRSRPALAGGPRAFGEDEADATGERERLADTWREERARQRQHRDADGERATARGRETREKHSEDVRTAVRRASEEARAAADRATRHR